MTAALHAVSVLGICAGVAALFLLAWLDDRERGEDGLPLLEEELLVRWDEEWAADWSWPS